MAARFAEKSHAYLENCRLEQALERLEKLIEQRESRLERFAALYADFGTLSWTTRLVELKAAPMRERVGMQRKKDGKSVSKVDIDEALKLDSEYVKLIDSVTAGKRDWTIAKEQWAVLNWRIQLELARLRLGSGADGESAGESDAEEQSGSEDE